MSHIIDLNKLKRKLNISDNDADADADLRLHAQDVRKFIETAIGPFESGDVVLDYAGTDADHITFSAKWLKTLQSIDKIEIIDADGNPTEIPADGWVAYEESAVVYRNSDYSYTPTAPDDGATFPTVEHVEKSIRMTSTNGWDSSGGDFANRIPDWLQDDWVMWTREYYETVLRRGRLSLEDKQTEKQRKTTPRVSEKEFKRHIFAYYHKPRRQAS